MSLISDSKGILRLQDARAFIDRFHKSVGSRLTGMEGKEALALLNGIRGNLLAEEAGVQRASSDIEALLQGLESAQGSAELESVIARFQRLVADQFRSRASVSTFLAYRSRLLELLIGHATATAAAMLQTEGIDPAENSWCVLVSGGLGRGEPMRGHPGRVILLADDSAGVPCDAFNTFAYSTLAILEPLLNPAKKRTLSGGRLFWSGSMTQWLESVDAGLSGRRDGATSGDQALFAETFTMVADLRPVCGALPLAEAAVSSSARKIAATFPGEMFRHFARKTAAMPVGIGIFGRFRTASRGRNRGKLSLEELAIKPLIAATRILAVSCGVNGTATVARIKGILASGNLGVTLADRLLIAYHDFMKAQIELELELPENGGEEPLFFDPYTLAEADRERFRDGLEAVTTLQRLAYQHLSGDQH